MNIGAAKRFFMSPLAERIFASDNVMREKKFAALFPAKFFYPELTGEAAEEKIVVQGIADCVFVEDGELVIVDYKTDTGVTPRLCSTDIRLSLRYTARHSRRRSVCPSKRRFCTHFS